MATGGSVTDSNDTLICPVCIDTFQDPRILPCGHSLCGPNSDEKCIIKLETQDGTITCPTCRETHNMKATDATVSFTLANLVAEMKLKRMCEKHSQEILFYCETDNQEFCMTCWQVDHMGGNHKVAPITTRADRKLVKKWRELDSTKLKANSRKEIELIIKLGSTLKQLKDREVGYHDSLAGLMDEDRDSADPDSTKLKDFFALELTKKKKDLNDWKFIDAQVCPRVTPTISTFQSTGSVRIKSSNQVHVCSSYHQVKVHVPTWKRMEIKSSVEMLTGTTPIFSPTENSLYVITMPYSFERYSYNPENISLKFEEIHQWKKPISCLALGPESSIYISFNSQKADVCQYFRQTGQLAPFDVSTVIGLINSMTSFPNKHILLLERDKNWFVFKNNKFIKALLMPPKGFFVITDDGTDNGLFVETVSNNGSSSVNVNRFSFKELEKPRGTPDASYKSYLPLQPMIKLPNSIERCLLSSICTNDKSRLILFESRYSGRDREYIKAHLTPAATRPQLVR